MDSQVGSAVISQLTLKRSAFQVEGEIAKALNRALKVGARHSASCYCPHQQHSAVWSYSSKASIRVKSKSSQKVLGRVQYINPKFLMLLHGYPSGNGLHLQQAAQRANAHTIFPFHHPSHSLPFATGGVQRILFTNWPHVFSFRLRLRRYLGPGPKNPKSKIESTDKSHENMRCGVYNVKSKFFTV